MTFFCQLHAEILPLAISRVGEPVGPAMLVPVVDVQCEHRCLRGVCLCRQPRQPCVRRRTVAATLGRVELDQRDDMGFALDTTGFRIHHGRHGGQQDRQVPMRTGESHSFPASRRPPTIDDASAWGCAFVAHSVCVRDANSRMARDLADHDAHCLHQPGLLLAEAAPLQTPGTRRACMNLRLQ